MPDLYAGRGNVRKNDLIAKRTGRSRLGGSGASDRFEKALLDAKHERRFRTLTEPANIKWLPMRQSEGKGFARGKKTQLGEMRPNG